MWMIEQRLKTPNYYPNRHRGSIQGSVKGVVLHFTASGEINGVIQWFENPSAQASAHYVVSRSGRIVQLVDERHGAWHAGARHTRPRLNGLAQLNFWTIGIEICNWGPLYSPAEDEITVAPMYDKDWKIVGEKPFTRLKGHYYTWMRWWTHEYHGPVPVHSVWNTPVLAQNDKRYPGGMKVEYWEPYPQPQIDAVEHLLRGIIQRYPAITREWITRHQDTDPLVKLDPGPAFPYARMLDTLYLPSPDEEEEEKIPVYEGGQGEEYATFKEFAEHYSPRCDDFEDDEWD